MYLALSLTALKCSEFCPNGWKLLVGNKLVIMICWDFKFLFYLTAKYKCSVAYGCIQLCQGKEQHIHPHFPAQKYPAIYQRKVIRRCAQPQTFLQAYGNILERKYCSHFSPSKASRNSPADGGFWVILGSTK